MAVNRLQDILDYRNLANTDPMKQFKDGVML